MPQGCSAARFSQVYGSIPQHSGGVTWRQYWPSSSEASPVLSMPLLLRGSAHRLRRRKRSTHPTKKVVRVQQRKVHALRRQLVRLEQRLLRLDTVSRLYAKGRAGIALLGLGTVLIVERFCGTA